MMLRAIGALGRPALAAVALQWSSIASGQQAFPSFREVDFFYSQQPQIFQTLWQTAHSQTIRIAILGDSQETSPNSHGFQYMPLLNHEMWKRFGNSPDREPGAEPEAEQEVKAPTVVAAEAVGVWIFISCCC